VILPVSMVSPSLGMVTSIAINAPFLIGHVLMLAD
jgi:hypothetical protein